MVHSLGWAERATAGQQLPLVVAVGGVLRGDHLTNIVYHFVASYS